MNVEKKILLIEDSESTRILYRQMLESREYSVVEAGDFQEGLGMAESEQPDLVLLGIMLPKVPNVELDREGVALLSKLRVSFPHIPVIMVTTIGAKKVKHECAALGAAGYFVKSGRLSKLLDLIEDVLALADQQMDLATELKNCEYSVFARGKHTEMDVVHMRPGLRTEIIAALRQPTQPRFGGEIK